MAKYSPIDILRKFVLRKNIEHLVWTSEYCTWVNLTFWENVTNKSFASKCWDKLSKALRRDNPNFRLVGVWARQRRGAWHIHAVCNQRFDIERLRSMAMRSGFGPQFIVEKLRDDVKTPEKISRYLAGYATDKNGLDKEKDKGVRRMILVGKWPSNFNMRYKSGLKQITSIGRSIADEIESCEYQSLNEFQKEICTPSTRKKVFESWGDWYRRNRERWFMLGWETLTVQQKIELGEMDEFCSRYFETGRWSYV